MTESSKRDYAKLMELVTAGDKLTGGIFALLWQQIEPSGLLMPDEVDEFFELIERDGLAKFVATHDRGEQLYYAVMNRFGECQHKFIDYHTNGEAHLHKCVLCGRAEVRHPPHQMDIEEAIDRPECTCGSTDVYKCGDYCRTYHCGNCGSKMDNGVTCG